MTHFPLFFELKNKNIIIYGSGAFAKQRIEKLMPFEPNITVISPEISEEIIKIKGIKLLEEDFSTAQLDTNPCFVITALDENKTRTIYNECKARGIPVNAVDMPEFCDIIFPSVIQREHLCVGISSGGISPTATIEFKDRFEELIPDNIDEIIALMPKAKAYIKESTPKEQQNRLLRAFFREALKETITPENLKETVEKLRREYGEV